MIEETTLTILLKPTYKIPAIKLNAFITKDIPCQWKLPNLPILICQRQH